MKQAKAAAPVAIAYIETTQQVSHAPKVWSWGTLQTFCFPDFATFFTTVSKYDVIVVYLSTSNFQ